VEATPSSVGAVGLIWYWPKAWRAVHTARIYTHGTTPGHPNGPHMKILWIFTSKVARRAYTGGDLVIAGRRLDGRGNTRQRFVPVGYTGQNGAPSFASIVHLPAAGCWQLRLSAGALHATLVFRAVS